MTINSCENKLLRDSLPQITTIPQLVNSASNNFSDHVFLEEGTTKITFSDFASQAQQVAAALIHKGIDKGDRIAIWAPNIYEWVIAAIGAQCAGAILVTLNTRYKGSEAGYILRQSGSTLLFCIGDFLNVNYPSLIADEELPDLKDIIVFRTEQAQEDPCHDVIDDHQNPIHQNPIHQNPIIGTSVKDVSRNKTRRPDKNRSKTSWENFLALADATITSTTDSTTIDTVKQRMADVSSEDVSDILFTSGTTGNPKGVMTCHGQNLRTFSNFCDIVGLEKGDRYLVINPFFHSFGYKAGILACLLKGVTLLPHAVFDTTDILNRIEKDRISVLPGPPTLFQSLLAHPELNQYKLSTLKRATTGAAVIPVELIHEMKARLGFECIITAYGLTESCGLVTACRSSDSAETIATTSGRAIAGVELRCVDRNNHEVTLGEAGEIVFRGYNVMKGYFENEVATAETIDSEGWLHTGDIGVMDAEGNLRITDRLKDMFITGGFNCYPAEIEKTLAAHDAIAMSAVIGIPDERMGEVAQAYVVLKANAVLRESDLVSWCRDKMANYKVPRQIIFIDALPLNASGKVLKTELKNKQNQRKEAITSN